MDGYFGIEVESGHGEDGSHGGDQIDCVDGR